MHKLSFVRRNGAKNKLKRSRNAVNNGTIRSPHAAALEALERNPDLIKGNHEHYSQVRVLYWLERNMPNVYKHTHSTPNGGLRTIRTAIKLVAEGQKKGYPDLSIDLAMGGYHGMRIEMKHEGNSLTTEQVEWMERLTEAGYFCYQAKSAEEAIRAIEHYVKLN